MQFNWSPDLIHHHCSICQYMLIHKHPWALTMVACIYIEQGTHVLVNSYPYTVKYWVLLFLHAFWYIPGNDNLCSNATNLYILLSVLFFTSHQCPYILQQTHYFVVFLCWNGTNDPVDVLFPLGWAIALIWMVLYDGWTVMDSTKCGTCR